MSYLLTPVQHSLTWPGWVGSWSIAWRCARSGWAIGS